MMIDLKDREWKEFSIGRLFSVSRPAERSIKQYANGKFPFVASGNANNGVIRLCAQKNNELPDPGNCITVSPIDGSSFYQPSDFLGRGGAGSSILILRNSSINKYAIFTINVDG